MGVAARRAMLTAVPPKPVFIAGSYGALALTSMDGLTWERNDPAILTNSTTANPYDDFGQMGSSASMTVSGYYRASAATGPVRRGLMTTANGKTWIDSTALNSQYLFSYQVANFGNSWLVPDSQQGYMWSSDNAATWTRLAFPAGVSCKGVVYAGGTINKWIVVNNNGVTFTTATPGTASSWAQGGIISSAPGYLTWSPDLGLVVVAMESVGLFYSSTNGTSWTYRGNGVNFTPTGSAAWSPEQGIFVTPMDSGRVATSTDGITWTTRVSGLTATGSVGAVAWSAAAGLFVATSQNVVSNYATSPNGTTWTLRSWTDGGNYGVRVNSLTATR